MKSRTCALCPSPKALQGKYKQEGTATVRIKCIALFWTWLFPLSCAWEKKQHFLRWKHLEQHWSGFCLGSKRGGRRDSAHNIHAESTLWISAPSSWWWSAFSSLLTSQELLELPAGDFCHYLALNWLQHITIHNTSKAFFLGNSYYRNHHTNRMLTLLLTFIFTSPTIL